MHPAETERGHLSLAARDADHTDMHIAAADAQPRRSGRARTPGMVLGVVGPTWVVERISVDPDGVLITPAVELVGASLLSNVHPGDVPDVQSTAAAARGRGASTGAFVQMGVPGRWSPVRIALTPMVGGELGFAITGPEDDAASQRTTRLEQHLWRIAREIEAAGVPIVAEGDVNLAMVPTLGALSSRQQEVLRRLLQGERVPGIARHLFLSPSTVRNHLTAIFAKFGVHSQEELIERLRTMSATPRSA